MTETPERKIGHKPTTRMSRPPPRHYTHEDFEKYLRGTVVHGVGLNLGPVRLPFNDAFAVHDGKAVAARFQVGGRHYNEDNGAMVVLNFHTNVDVCRAFNDLLDCKPIPLFRNEGSNLFYRGMYILTGIDRQTCKWTFRRLKEAWQATYDPINLWIKQWQQKIGVGATEARYVFCSDTRKHARTAWKDHRRDDWKDSRRRGDWRPPTKQCKFQ